jgi:sensor histidine kinase YesM
VFVFILALAGVVLVFLVSISYSSKLLTRQLTMIMNEMSSDGSSILETYHEVPVTSDDEFGTLSEKLNELIAKIRKNHEEIVRAERTGRKLELMVLQDRINPHLLYNTLSAIKYTYRDEHLSQIIDTMVRYYRLVLSRGSAEIILKDELAMIEQYLLLHRFAYDAGFDFRIEIESGIGECLVLKMVVQPFVENALLHGISDMLDEGIVRVAARSAGDCIEIVVSDNGCGMPEQRAAEVMSGDYTRISGGYGVYNVHERLQMYYGEEYGIRLESAVDAGTSVVVRIPRRLPPVAAPVEDVAHETPIWDS